MRVSEWQRGAERRLPQGLHPRRGGFASPRAANLQRPSARVHKVATPHRSPPPFRRARFRKIYFLSTKVDILRNFLIMNQLVTNNLILARVLHGCQTSDLLRSNEIISSLSLKCSSNCAMRARSSSFSFAMSVEPERAMLLPLNEETALLPIDR